MVDYKERSVQAHKKTKGKLEIRSKMSVTNKEELSIAYSPGVAGPSLEIKNNPSIYNDLVTPTIAVISDGSAVLGLGNIGPKAAMPVMEGKAVLFKEFANLDALPIVLDTQDSESIIQTIKTIAPTFAGINLEDIAAPRCFEIEERLKEELDIPVFHDDQHGTAIVVLAAIINYLKLSKKTNPSIVINGSGAAGIAIANLLHVYGFSQIVMCDSKGAISKERSDLTEVKKKLLQFTNKENVSGTIHDVIKNTDIFIGVSKGDLLEEEHIKSMNENPAIFALANPDPEITPQKAKAAGALVIGTGRSDFPNQINNVLVFPGIFKGALHAKKKSITDQMKLLAAKALADLVTEPTADKVIPEPFDKRVVDAVANAVQ